MSLLLEIRLEQDLIGFFLGLAEDNCSAVSSSIEVDDIGDDGVSVIVGAVKGEMLDSFGGSYASILN